MANICPICFDDLNLEGKEKASPDACDHVFCLPCLEKWSKLGSYCPVDRKRYKKIVNLDSESVIQIKPRKRKRKRVVYDFSTTCEVCNTDEDPDTLLLCDCCDLGFHCYCLTPPLDTVPAGLWFCPTCVTVEQKLKQRKGITKEMELDYDIFLQKLNYYEPASPQTKKQKVPSPRKSGGVQDTCNDIISVFEDINVVPDSGTNVKTDLNVSIDHSEMDKMLKTFNFISENKASNSFHVKSLKTYLHEPNVEVFSKPNLRNCTQDKGNISENFKKNFENNIFCYLSHSTSCSKVNCMINNKKSKLCINVKEPCEPKNQNENSKEANITQLDSQNSISEIIVGHNKLSLNRKKHLLFKNNICKEGVILKEVNDGNHDDTGVVHDNFTMHQSEISKDCFVGRRKTPFTDLAAPLETDAKTLSSKSSPEKPIKVILPENFKNDLKLSTAFHPVVKLKKISILDFLTTSAPAKCYNSYNETSSEDFFSRNNDEDSLIIESVVESELPDENYYNLVCGTGVCDSPVTPVVEEHPPIKISEIRTNISLNRCEMCSEVIFRSFNGSSLCKICKKFSSKSQYNQTYDKLNSKTDLYSIDVNETVRRNLFAEQRLKNFHHNNLYENHKPLPSNNYENTSILKKILGGSTCSNLNERKSLDLKDLKNHLIIRSDGSLYLDYEMFENRYMYKKNIKSQVLEEPSCSSSHNESKSFYLSDLRHNLRIRRDGSFYLDY